MAGKTPAAARDAYLEPLQKALGCVSPAVFIHNSRDANVEDEYYVALPNGDPIRVPCTTGNHLSVRIEQRFRIVHLPNDRDKGPYRVNTLKYEYSLDDDDGTEIMGFHWHPREQGFDGPHTHLSYGSGALRKELQRAYVPSGRVTLEDFIMFLIRDFNVTARNTGYKRILEGSKTRFNLVRSW